MTGAVAPTTGAAPAASTLPDPNFSGEWRAVRHDNLEALLRAQGVPDRNIQPALTTSTHITQRIRHTSADISHQPPHPPALQAPAAPINVTQQSYLTDCLVSCVVSAVCSRHHFRVTVNSYTTTYLIVSGHSPQPDDNAYQAEHEDDDTADFTPDQLLTGSTMHWQQTADDAPHDGTNSGQQLVVSSGAPGTHSERRMEDGRMVVVNEKDGVRATSWFERRDAAVQHVLEEEERKQKLLHDSTP